MGSMPMASRASKSQAHKGVHVGSLLLELSSKSLGDYLRVLQKVLGKAWFKMLAKERAPHLEESSKLRILGLFLELAFYICICVIKLLISEMDRSSDPCVVFF